MEGVKIASESATPPTYNNVGGGFLTGNPGRPKGIVGKRTDAGRKAAQALSSEAWEVVRHLLDDKDGKLRLDAAKIVIEYAHGKPRQTVSIEDLRESAEEVAFGYGLSESDFGEVIGIAEQIAAKGALPS